MKIPILSIIMSALTSPAASQALDTSAPTINADLWQSAWAVADTDGDGRISREEFSAINPDNADWFGVLDADGDGFITQEEALAGRTLRHAAQSE